ncbi:hypothetical protein [Lysobacter enzymogenes]|uniref:hypothetical protein n=1 Tax=Lysobacter enzymogenes TaxID=69 RepID=UPI00099C95AD|nr:hypothetical protein [Lysobacter enzymogenes]UZW60231.1 hypothetical protein BV903_023635 [Lysobacter enzymogenes]
MKIQFLPLCAGLLAMSAMPAALAQSYTKQAELDLAATGETFSIGQTQYRIAPAAEVKRADAATDPRRDVIVGEYVVEPKAAAANARSKRAVDAVAGNGLGAAVSANGRAVVVAPELNVYFSNASVVDAVVRETGGTLLYSSAAGGKATIGYASLAEAMKARQRILGKAGVKEVSPRLVQQRRVAW